MPDDAMTYEGAGVDRRRARAAIRHFVDEAVKGPRKGVVDLGDAFAGLFHLKGLEPQGWRDPVIVGTTDGVGTKLLIASALGKLDTIGIDLVAMNVNDLLPCGARPIFFLDYVASGRISPERLAAVAKGIGDGCRDAEVALLGGETAEMPGVYPDDGFDLAGFAVGVVERDRVIDGHEVSPGDLILGLPSTGVHSNGFSFVRKIIHDAGVPLDARPPRLGGKTLGEALLTPTRIYVSAVNFLLRCFEPNREIRAMAHITGGGIVENLIRVLPEGRRAVIHRGSWEILPVFEELQEMGKVELREMFKVFNMGLGLLLIVPEDCLDAVARILAYVQGQVRVVGEVVDGPRGVVIESPR